LAKHHFIHFNLFNVPFQRNNKRKKNYFKICFIVHVHVLKLFIVKLPNRGLLFVLYILYFVVLIYILSLSVVNKLIIVYVRLDTSLNKV